MYPINDTMTRIQQRTIQLSAALLVIILSSAAQASDWRFTITPYTWATNIGVDAKLNGRQVVDENIAVTDLIEDLNTIFQMRMEAQRGELGLMLDIFDVTLTDEASGVNLPQDAGQASLKSDVGMTLFDIAGIYDPNGDHQGISFLAGVRLLNERATIDASLDLNSGQTVPQSYETDDWMVDALAGVRFVKRFTRHWSYQMQADISTGETDYTWSVGPAIGYAFGKYGQFGVTAGYRRMVIDFADHDDMDSQMTLSGPVLSFRMSL